MAIGTKQLAPSELDTFEDQRLVEELRKEFPDKTVAELVAMADERVNQIIEERRAAEGPSMKIETVAEDEEVPDAPAQ